MNGKEKNLYVSPNQIEHHPLKPFLPANARLLMLGSFPPPLKRWSMDFFYPNMQNDMWRIFGICFHNDKQFFIDEQTGKFCKERIVEFLSEMGIALYDMATSVCRLQENASDKYLEVIEPTNASLLLRHLPLCQTIVTTGQKSTELLCKEFEIDSLPSVGGFTDVTFNDRQIRIFRMPSSSRAYPLSLEKKANVYALMFQHVFQ